MGLVAFSLAIPVDFKADEIPVQVIVAESVPAEVPVAVKAEIKSIPVEEVAQKEVVVESTVEPAKETLKTEAPVAIAVVEQVKEKEVVKETDEDLDASTTTEKKSDEPVKADEDKSKTEEDKSKTEEDKSKTEEDKSKAEDDKSKDLETQSSVWAAPGWGSAPAVYTSAWPVPVASSYHSGWSHYPKAYPYYYEPTAHYSSHYSSPSYWPGYVSSGWW